VEFLSIRKACIELNKTLKNAALFAGDLGGGKCLHFIGLSDKDLVHEPTVQEWKSALNQCIAKAGELKYEVSRIRGRRLAEEVV